MTSIERNLRKGTAGFFDDMLRILQAVPPGARLDVISARTIITATLQALPDDDERRRVLGEMLYCPICGCSRCGRCRCRS